MECLQEGFDRWVNHIQICRQQVTNKKLLIVLADIPFKTKGTGVSAGTCRNISDTMRTCTIGDFIVFIIPVTTRAEILVRTDVFFVITNSAI